MLYISSNNTHTQRSDHHDQQRAERGTECTTVFQHFSSGTCCLVHILCDNGWERHKYNKNSSPVYNSNIFLILLEALTSLKRYWFSQLVCLCAQLPLDRAVCPHVSWHVTVWSLDSNKRTRTSKMTFCCIRIRPLAFMRTTGDKKKRSWVGTTHKTQKQHTHVHACTNTRTQHLSFVYIDPWLISEILAPHCVRDWV